MNTFDCVEVLNRWIAVAPASSTPESSSDFLSNLAVYTRGEQLTDWCKEVPNDLYTGGVSLGCDNVECIVVSAVVGMGRSTLFRRSGKGQSPVNPCADLCIVPLIIRRNDSMSHQKVDHDNRGIGFELASCESAFDLVHVP